MRECKFAGVNAGQLNLGFPLCFAYVIRALRRQASRRRCNTLLDAKVDFTTIMKLCFALWLSTVSAFAPANVRLNRVRDDRRCSG